MINDKMVRSSNIELLRILLIFGVIILHFNNREMGGGLALVTRGTINEAILMLLEVVFICAVDVFVIISGYFMVSKTKNSIDKPIKIFLQAAILNVVAYVTRYYLYDESISIKGMFVSLIPVNYYVVLYITLYMISPLLNRIISIISPQFTKIIILLLLLFSVEPTLVDLLQVITGNTYLGLSTIGMYGSQWGYSIVNFILLYFIGAFIKISDKNWFNCFYKVCIIFIVCIFALFIWQLFDEKTALAYNNPLVILESVALFSIFEKISIKSKVVNYIAKSTFSVFLFHTVLIPLVNIGSIVLEGPFEMIGLYLAYAIAIFLFCSLLGCLYEGTIGKGLSLLLSKKKRYIIDVSN